MANQTAFDGRVKRTTLGTLLVFGAVLTSQWTGVKVFGLNLCDLLIVAAFAVVLLEVGLGVRRLILRWWMPLPAVGAFLIYAIGEISGGLQDSTAATNTYVSGATALGDEGGGWLFVARIVMATLLIAVIVTSEGDSFGRDRVLSIVRLWTLGAAISATTAVTDFFGLTNVTSFTFHQVSGERALGLAFQPNSLAQTIALALPFMVWFSLTRGKSRLLWLAALVLSITALIMSNSRGGILTGITAVALTLVVLLGRGPRGRMFMLLIAIPLGIAAYFLVEWLLANTRLGGGGGAEISDAGRWALIDQGMTAFLSNPVFGAGLGGGAGVMVPLLVASSGGVFFLATYYLFTLPTLRRAIRTRGDLLVSVCAVSIIALLVAGLFNNSVNERYDFVIVAATASLVYAIPAVKARGSAYRTRAYAE